ncbi:hypothetical protein PTI98_004290 [Pleurotus ostreatus]|nr:hypothetical protein PTI98_004290 [Pleurotus ostreatus]
MSSCLSVDGHRFMYDLPEFHPIYRMRLTLEIHTAGKGNLHLLTCVTLSLRNRLVGQSKYTTFCSGIDFDPNIRTMDTISRRLRSPLSEHTNMQTCQRTSARTPGFDGYVA